MPIINLLLLLLVVSLLVTKERKEDIVTDLNSIDVKKALRGWNKGKIDGMCRDPNSPRTHDGCFQIV